MTKTIYSLTFDFFGVDLAMEGGVSGPGTCKATKLNIGLAYGIWLIFFLSDWLRNIRSPKCGGPSGYVSVVVWLPDDNSSTPLDSTLVHASDQFQILTTPLYLRIVNYIFSFCVQCWYDSDIE